MKPCRASALALLASSAFAQSSAPLPPNYTTILNNADVLVQRVHYGPHEFVPMHNHPAVTTIYVYLDNSGVVDIAHEGPDAETVHRPPTHTGAFRISPGSFERHSVQNQSELPSDFLRIELKQLPVNSLPAEFRSPAPTEPYHPIHETLYNNPALRIERLLCVPREKCTDGVSNEPSVLVVMPLKSTSDPNLDPVIWLPANADYSDKKYATAFDGIDQPCEILRIILPKH